MPARNSGFTLIELLVVIAIIGLFASLILVAVSKARIEARDSKRIAEVHELYVAMEAYLNDHPGNPPWCGDPGYAGGCDLTSFDGQPAWVDTSLDGIFMNFLETGGYIGKTPPDPINVFPYAFFYGSGEFPTGSGKYYVFAIGATLEDPSNQALETSFKLGMPGTENTYVIAEPR